MPENHDTFLALRDAVLRGKGTETWEALTAVVAGPSCGLLPTFPGLPHPCPASGPSHPILLLPPTPLCCFNTLLQRRFGLVAGKAMSRWGWKFHAKMSTIKDRNNMDPTEAAEITKRYQEYTEEQYKKHAEPFHAARRWWYCLCPCSWLWNLAIAILNRQLSRYFWYLSTFTLAIPSVCSGLPYTQVDSSFNILNFLLTCHLFNEVFFDHPI